MIKIPPVSICQKGIISALGEAADDPKTKMVVLTGQGSHLIRI